MTVTVTPVQPSDNSVTSAAQVTVQVIASTDTGTITGGTIVVNNGTPLTMSFDAVLGVWKRQISVVAGPVLCKVDMVDSGSNHGIAYVAFSRSDSVNPAAAIIITHPTEGQTVRSPGVVLQADISRTSDIVKVEASVDQGISWVPMAIPPSSGGS